MKPRFYLFRVDDGSILASHARSKSEAKKKAQKYFKELGDKF